MNLERLGRANTLGFALTGATVMIAQQVAGKATRDALFLSQFAVEHLPKAVIAGALVSLIGVLSTLYMLHLPLKLVVCLGTRCFALESDDPCGGQTPALDEMERHRC